MTTTTDWRAMVAISPLTSGLTLAPTSPLRTRGELCPQGLASSLAPAATSAAVRAGDASVAGARAAVPAAAAAADPRVDLSGIDLNGRGIGLMGENSAPRPQHVELFTEYGTQFATQYGKTPHTSGTRVRKPPV